MKEFEGSSNGSALRVGDLTVVPSLNLLVRGGERIRVEPRLMDILTYLIERAGEVISKQELMERVWNDRHVTDDVLTVSIYNLRKALGDEARQPRYIQTVSRRGYLLIAPVQAASPEGGAALVETDAESVAIGAARAAPAGYSLRAKMAAPAIVALVLAMALVFAATRPPRHVVHAEAQQAYLKGRYLLDQRSIQGWQRALTQFEEAISLDPNYPAAQAGLADIYSAMADFGVASSAEMRPRAIHAARRALGLDSRSAEGYAALGRIQFLFDWDFSSAELSLRRAIALDPGYMPAFQSMAWFGAALGRYDEAVAAAKRALELDPVNTARYTELAWVLGLAGRYREALQEIDRALELNPRSFEAYLMKGWASELAGQPDVAFAAYRDGLGIGGAPKESLDRLEVAYRAGGLSALYRTWLNRRSSATPMSDTWRAQLFVRIGEPEHAIECLERAYQKHEGALAWIHVEPSFRPLRTSVRFQQIAVRVGR